nr:MAG TPA: hypothetical protein [Caudoviricetes sp.]
MFKKRPSRIAYNCSKLKIGIFTFGIYKSR